MGALLDALGTEGRGDPYTDGTRIAVLRADPSEWWCRRPVAVLHHGWELVETEDHGVPLDPPRADGAREQDPLPEIVPPGLGRATLGLWSGRAVLELRYDDAGLVERERVLCRFGDPWTWRRWAAVQPPSVDPTARPAQADPPAWLVDLPADPPTIDELATRILASGPDRDSVRVRMNVDAPGGVEGCWYRAMQSLRQLAFEDRVPGGGGVAVLDAYEHEADRTCLAVGPDLEQALVRWKEEERRVRPRPTPSRPPPRPVVEDEPSSELEVVDEDGARSLILTSERMTLTLRPDRMIPWPIPGPSTTPLVAVRLPPLPSSVPPTWAAVGFARWRYLVGESGEVRTALVRDDAGEGSTVVGEELLDVLDPGTLDRELDAAVAADVWPFPFQPWLERPYEQRSFAAWDLAGQCRAPLRVETTSWGAGFHGRDMDGDAYGSRVARLTVRTDDRS
ncbi:MAG: hypothetical protein H6735_22220 [Alphaproteobacteria bacterium]|nr:hypothetical protein [Alphaproteobacteria bacterium]